MTKPIEHKKMGLIFIFTIYFSENKKICKGNFWGIVLLSTGPTPSSLNNENNYKYIKSLKWSTQVSDIKVSKALKW